MGREPSSCCCLACVSGAQPRQAGATHLRRGLDQANPDQQGGIKPLLGGNGYTAENVTVRLMISLMYKVPERQISGGLDRLDSDRYDVEARADLHDRRTLHRVSKSAGRQVQLQIKFRKDSHEGNVYELTVDKGGLKMKEDSRG
jgi:uncharacterized protein (TIGR03435 family)